MAVYVAHVAAFLSVLFMALTVLTVTLRPASSTPTPSLSPSTATPPLATSTLLSALVKRSSETTTSEPLTSTEEMTSSDTSLVSLSSSGATSSPTTSSPTSAMPSTSSTMSSSSTAAYAPHCPVDKLASSPEWMTTEGQWASPCTSSEQTATTTSAPLTVPLWLLQAMQSSSSGERAKKEVVTDTQEAGDEADKLRRDLLTSLRSSDLAAYITRIAANLSLVPADPELDNNKTSSSSVQVRHVYWRISASLVFLEQCVYDAEQCQQNMTLVRGYQHLENTLLQVLCQVKFRLDALSGTRPVVLRSLMTSEVRDVSNDGQRRVIRDYVIISDVIKIMKEAELIFEGL